MKNFSVQYLLSHIEKKNDVSAVPTSSLPSNTLNLPSTDDVGKSQIFAYWNFCFFFSSLLDDDHRSSDASSIYESSNEEDDEQRTLNVNPHDSGTTSEDSEASKYLSGEPTLHHHHHHHHETSKRRKRRVLFTKQQTFELERRFRQQRYLSGRETIILYSSLMSVSLQHLNENI